jgi:hypothetical protein
MGTLAEIERAVVALDQEKLAAFRAWFSKYDADNWDRRIEADVAAGRLDALASEALADLREGRCVEL